MKATTKQSRPANGRTRDEIQSAAVRAAHELLSRAMLETIASTRIGAVGAVVAIDADMWPDTISTNVARAIRSLNARGAAIDLTTVYEEVRALGLPVTGVDISALDNETLDRHVGSVTARVDALKEWALYNRRVWLSDALADPALSPADFRHLLADSDLLSLLPTPQDDAQIHPFDILNAPAPPPVLWNGGPELGCFGILGGRNGLGKGWTGLTMGTSVATGVSILPFLRDIHRGRVGILSREDGAGTFRYRLEAIGHKAGCWADISSALASGALQIGDAPTLFTQDQYGAMTMTPGYDALRRWIVEQRLTLVFLDPLTGIAVLKTEGNSEFAFITDALAALAEETGCTIILVHHLSKAGADLADSNSLRGGSSLACRARWIAMLAPALNVPDPDVLELSIVKDSYHRAAAPVLLRRTESGALVQEERPTYDAAEIYASVREWLADNPAAKASEGGVRHNSGADSKALLAYIRKSAPWLKVADAGDAISMGVKNGMLSVRQAARKNGSLAKYLSLPVCPKKDEE